MGLFNRNKKTQSDEFMGDGLSLDQKLACVSLMYILGGASNGSPIQVSQINSIMSQSIPQLGLSASQAHLSQTEKYSDGFMDYMKTIHDRDFLKKLFVTYFRITRVTQEKNALLMLISVYEKLGFEAEELADYLKQNV